MSQSLAQVYLHLVFSTKNRTPYLNDKPTRASLHAYLATVSESLKSPCIKAGGIADHLVRFGRTLSIATLIKELKRTSSLWIKREFNLSGFDWQNGYGAFSISPSHVSPLTKYIANQEAHHKKESFQDELRRLLKKYQVQYDEKYVWD